MKELQTRVDDFISLAGGYWSPLAMVAALTEELGELAEAVLGREGVKPSESSVEEEVGDVLFALICIANVYGIDLERALELTLEKYGSRL